MQLPTVTSQGAERRLERQRDTQSGRSTDSGGGDGARCAPLRVSSTMQLPTVTSRGAERRLERQRGTKSSSSLESGGSDGDECTAELEHHDVAPHRDEPRSGEASEAAARLAERPEHRQRQKRWR